MDIDTTFIGLAKTIMADEHRARLRPILCGSAVLEAMSRSPEFRRVSTRADGSRAPATLAGVPILCDYRLPPNVVYRVAVDMPTLPEDYERWIMNRSPWLSSMTGDER